VICTVIDGVAVARVDGETFAKRFPGFAEALAGPQLVTLLSACETLEVGAGEALIEQGTTADALFLVWDGELDVSTQTRLGTSKFEQVRTGDILGEISLLDPGPATATVVSDAGCSALRISRARFEQLCREHPDLAAPFVAELVRQMERRLASATQYLQQLEDQGSGSATAERVPQAAV
jgi:CRP-like cAMP-binding protein